MISPAMCFEEYYILGMKIVSCGLVLKYNQKIVDNAGRFMSLLYQWVHLP